ncbi:MAG: hypothetical protein HY296_01625 [Thaumarchaeota archaeon]|nr:hypothetical protein [Nitrososphaerota archaeon]
MSVLPADVDRLVRSAFDVKDAFILPDGEVEYKVTYGPASKQGFVDLLSKLEGTGFSAFLAGPKEECALTLRQKAEGPRKPSSIPLILGLVSLVSIIIFGILERTVYGEFAPGYPGYQVFLIYAGGVTAILVGHEAGHRYASRKERGAGVISYLIPGIPDVTPLFPAFGPITAQRGPAVNRDKLFDILIWGPILAFLISVTFYIAGEFFWVRSALPLQQGRCVLSAFSVCQINPSATQYAIDFVLSPFTSQSAPAYARFSPIGDAATVGFLLTFVGLLPMASFDGGLISTAAWGARSSRLATYLCVFLLLSIDTPTVASSYIINYWAIAVVVLLLAGRPPSLQLRDEVSGVSRRRKWLYLGVIALAFACLPLPQNFLTFPLP